MNQVDGARIIERENRWDRDEYAIQQAYVPNPKGHMAMQMIEKWAMVAALPDGEDAAGRQKLRIQTPEELVQRACDTAELCFNEFRTRGWLLDIPEPKAAEPKEEAA